MKLTATVNNLPTYISKYGWVVVRLVDGELWYYDAWYADQGDKAKAQALEEDGIVLKVEA